jgi:hypothetical protein
LISRASAALATFISVISTVIFVAIMAKVGTILAEGRFVIIAAGVKTRSCGAAGVPAGLSAADGPISVCVR